jgi:3-phytase
MYRSSILLVFLIFTACAPKRLTPTMPQIFADAETPPVQALSTDDSADDPAIWYNRAAPERSVIIGTVKKYGLEVYDLDGKRLHRYQIGNPNNVDVRYGFPLADGTTVDIAACTDRSTNRILVFKINPSDGSLTQISGDRIRSNAGEVYGICLYKNKQDQQFYAFLNTKGGIIEQYRLSQFGTNEVTGQMIRTLSLKTQPEGMVADDENGIIYIGEEDKGVWKFRSDSTDTPQLLLVPNSGQNNPNITYDVEGMAIYPTSSTTGYLVVSSQGNNSYAIFERQGNNRYIGSFQLGNGPIDGTFDTDGLDICAERLNKQYPKGLFVAQDGNNTDASGKTEPQNFKLVSWEKIWKVIEQFGR